MGRPPTGLPPEKLPPKTARDCKAASPKRTVAARSRIRGAPLPCLERSRAPPPSFPGRVVLLGWDPALQQPAARNQGRHQQGARARVGSAPRLLAHPPHPLRMPASSACSNEHGIKASIAPRSGQAQAQAPPAPNVRAPGRHATAPLWSSEGPRPVRRTAKRAPGRGGPPHPRPPRPPRLLPSSAVSGARRRPPP